MALRAYKSVAIAVVLGVVAQAGASGTPARADGASALGGATDAGDVGPSPAAQTALDVKTGQAPETGMVVGGFLVYPSLFIGGVFNDNIYESAANRQAALGLRITPTILAVNDQGLHKTTFGLAADGQFYPGAAGASASGQTASNVTGKISLDHVWSPTTDLAVDLSASFTRAFGFFAPAGVGVAPFAGSIKSTTVLGNQQFSNTAAAAVAVEKKFFDQVFVRGGLGIQDLAFQSAPVGVVGALGGTDANGFVRAGFYVTPRINAFVEGGGDFWRYRDSSINSNIYYLVGGLSSDLISLFRGEVYFGRQDEYSARTGALTYNAPSFGGKLYYYPTRYLTLAASLEQTIGSAAASTSVLGASPGALTLQARFEADYALAEYWSAFARAGYAHSRWASTPFVESVWTVGGGVSYNFWRSVALTLEYEHYASHANFAGAPVYAQNLISAGMTYRY